MIVGKKQYIGVVSILDIIAFVFNNSDICDIGAVQAILSRPIFHAIGSNDESLSLWTVSLDSSIVSV